MKALMANQALKALDSYLGRSVVLEGPAYRFQFHTYFADSPTGRAVGPEGGILIVLPGLFAELSYIGAVKTRGGYNCPSRLEYLKVAGNLDRSLAAPFAASLTEITEVIAKTYDGLVSVDLEKIGEPRESEIAGIMRDSILTLEEKEESIQELRENRLKW